MSIVRTATLVLAALVTVPQVLGQTAEQWATAAQAIRRLAPAAFPHLPATVRQALEQRGCTVPQSFVDRSPHNVVRGHFARPRQTDWAVLCSRRDTSVVLVFWAGRATDPAALNPQPDATFLQGIGGGAIGFSRVLGVATASHIRRYAEAHGSLLPTRMDHDGLEDAFAEKASTIVYWDAGQWLSLPGAD
jgi:hypothetical protein